MCLLCIMSVGVPMEPIREIQRDALNSSVSVTDLLRKALVIANKLKLKEFEEWVNLELSGYGSAKQQDYPNYRKLTAEVKANNPYYGWQPVIFQSPELADAYSKCPLYQSVGEIEKIVTKEDLSSSTFQVPFSPKTQSRLIAAMGSNLPVTRFVNPANVFGILESVRNIILKWSLKLEGDGILGHGYTFTPEEQKKAISTQINVQNFYGPVVESQIQLSTNKSNQYKEIASEHIDIIKTWLEKLEKKIDDLDLKSEDKSEAHAEVSTLKAQINSPFPKVPIIKSSLSTLKRILENAAASAIANGLLSQFPMW